MRSATNILVTNYFWEFKEKHYLIAPGKRPKTVGLFNRWQKGSKNASFKKTQINIILQTDKGIVAPE